MSLAMETTITGLNYGTAKISDITASVDITDFLQSTAGTTKKYSYSDYFNLYFSLLGLSNYNPVKYATTVNLSANYDNGSSGVGATLTNSGTLLPLFIDGFNPVYGDRVLNKDQVSPSTNGIYIVTNAGSMTTAWKLTRAVDCNSSSNIIDNKNVLVTFGTINGNTFWELNVTGSVVVGTTPIVFGIFNLTSSLPLFPILPQDGGTGINNNSSDTITLGGSIVTSGIIATGGNFTSVGSLSFAGNFQTQGSSDLTLIATAPTMVTFPSGTTTLIGSLGSNTITTLGLITTGTWRGTKIQPQFGGTGVESFVANAVICGGTTTTGALQTVDPGTTVGQVLSWQGVSAKPTWINSTAGSGTVNSGTTGQTTYYAANGTTVSGSNSLIISSTLVQANQPLNLNGIRLQSNGSTVLDAISGTSNIFLGILVGNTTITGTGRNTAIGTSGFGVATTANNNILIGYGVGTSMTTAAFNVLIGNQSGAAISTGSGVNVGIGHNTLKATVSLHSVAIGGFALLSQTTGSNTAVGFNSGQSIINGSGNCLMGLNSGQNITAGSDCVSIGDNSMSLGLNPILTGRMVAIGTKALSSIEGGTFGCIAVGYNALQNAVTSNNSGTIAIGYSALSAFDSLDGRINIAIGPSSGLALTSGGDNILVGKSSGTNLTTGSSNCTFGQNTLSNGNASNTIAIGLNALSNQTSDNATAVGYLAGATQSSVANCTFIGANSDATGSFSNSSALGYQSSITASNQIVLGNSSVTSIIPGGNNVSVLGSVTHSLANVFSTSLAILNPALAFKTSITSSASLATDTAIILPATAGSNNQVLTLTNATTGQTAWGDAYSVYNGTSVVTNPIMWMGSATTTTGVATFFPTSDGTGSGTALFPTSITASSAIPTTNTSTATSFPFASIKVIAADRKTITVNVGVGVASVGSGSASATTAPDGTVVTLILWGN